MIEAKVEDPMNVSGLVGSDGPEDAVAEVPFVRKADVKDSRMQIVEDISCSRALNATENVRKRIKKILCCHNYFNRDRANADAYRSAAGMLLGDADGVDQIQDQIRVESMLMCRFFAKGTG